MSSPVGNTQLTAPVHVSRVADAMRLLWPVLFSGILAVAVWRVGVVVVAALAGVVVASWLAYRFRAATTMTLLLVTLLPLLLQMTGLLPDTWDLIGSGVRFGDLILAGMAGATAMMLLNGGIERARSRVLARVFALMVVVLLISALRNWGAYGISAFGELRFRYLILALPMYLAIGLDREGVRRAIARSLAWFPLLGVVAFLPIVGSTKGWAIGAASRFYPSAISLAVLFSVIWISMSHRETSRKSTISTYAVFAVAALVIVADSHRSVWLVAAACVLLLTWLGVIHIGRIWSWGLLAVTLAVAVVSILSLSGLDVLQYLAIRGQAFVNPSADQTSYWRLVVWKAYLQPWLQSPLLGEGLGGYWNIYVPELDTAVATFPHSMYVQTLVKLGAVGMATLLAWFAAAWRVLVRTIRRAPGSVGSRSPLVVMGILAVASSLVYGTVYTLDFWNLAWIGVGLAEVLNRSEKAVVV